MYLFRYKVNKIAKDLAAIEEERSQAARDRANVYSGSAYGAFRSDVAWD
jgi:hypothetical protein